MHHIYHTEGIILGSSDVGEADKRYAMLTRELGLVYARARGVRTLASKLRFVLQDFAYVKADLVLGHREWRITSASKTERLERLAKNRAALRIFDNLARLLRRLLVPAEPNEQVFADLLEGLRVLEQATSGEDRENAEAGIVLRILHSLGYVGGGTELEELLESPFGSELLAKVAASKRSILGHINKALRESHL